MWGKVFLQNEKKMEGINFLKFIEGKKYSG